MSRYLLKTSCLIFSLFLLPGCVNGKTMVHQEPNIVTSFHQKNKQNLNTDDYKLWENVKTGFRDSNSTFSNNSQWIAYSYWKNPLGLLGHKKHGIYVVSTRDVKKYELPFCRMPKFNLQSEWLGALSNKQDLALLDLNSGITEWFANVSVFEFSADGHYVIYAQKEPSNLLSTVIVRDLSTGKQHSISDVKAHKFNSTLNSIAYVQQSDEGNSVQYIKVGERQSKTIHSTNNADIKNLVWNNKGTALAFLLEQYGAAETEKRHAIYYYPIDAPASKPLILDQITDASIFPNRNIMDSELNFNPEGNALYFKVAGEGDVSYPIVDSETSEAQVWRTSDKVLYQKRKRNKTHERLATWNMKTNKAQLLETKKLPKILVISNNGQYVLSYNPLYYEPNFQVKSLVPKDIYISNLNTGRQELFIKKYRGDIGISPANKYISYFKDKHWWVYDLEKETHTNITKGLKAVWYNDGPGLHPHKNILTPYGYAGTGRTLDNAAAWTNSDKELLVYDKYDAWLITPTGIAKKITNGRKLKIKYRLYNTSNLYNNNPSKYSTSNWYDKNVDLTQDLVFRTKGIDHSSGYAVWNRDKGVEVLVHKNMRLTSLRKSDADEYIYNEQSFNVSPRIRHISKVAKTDIVVAKSNTQQDEYNWGHSELIYYKGPSGEDLKGALFYPANYKKGKEYPMVVEIYEGLSRSLHRYQSPSEFSSGRINYTHYTLNDYFVLRPDIGYQHNKVGVSATKSVEAAVKSVLAKGDVDAGRIGLVGHSFGGFEANIIITQSNMFSAAVSGAAVSDVVSSYHGFSNALHFRGSNMHRSEDWQYKYDGSFYENPKAYIENSPIHHAKNITTPLLLWAGKKDDTVNYLQSFEMYFGLRRLGKTAELAFYPDDVHGLNKQKNQLDLGRRMMAWFDRYLKPEMFEDEAP